MTTFHSQLKWMRRQQDNSRFPLLLARSRLTLIGFMDDTTGKVLAMRFRCGPEDTAGYMTTLRMLLVEEHGIP